MIFSTVLVLSAAAAGVFAAPVAQAATTSAIVAAATIAAEPAVTAAVVSAAGNNNRQKTSTTTKKTTTKKTTTTVSTTTATPTPTGLPKCNGRQSFHIKARGLENYSGNKLPSVAIGQFVVDVGGPMGFSSNPSTEYFLDQSGFLTQSGTGLIATVKTVVAGTPHVGDIVFLKPDQSIALNYSPLRCSGDQAGTLGCVANQNNRKVLQVCGKFINMDPTPNANCQDQIAFDVVKTCQF